MIKKLIQTAKNLLAIRWIRRSYETATRLSLELGAANRFTATIYSLPGFATFNREQYAVLRGRRDYYRNLRKARISHVELRRNVHRLEKGMSMQPRRPVFAKDYIDETVDFYLTAVTADRKVAGTEHDQRELAWAHDVLAHYFDIVDDSDPVVAKAKSRFLSHQGEIVTDGTSRPFARKESVRSDVTYEQLQALSMQRRSVRWFLDKPVPRELIDKAIEVAVQAPTACNRSPFEYLVYDDPEMVKKVADLPSGAGGYRHQIPTIVVIKGNQESYFSPRDRHLIYIDGSLSVMGFMYALETLGLASSSINWPDFEPLELKMAQTLGLRPSERVVMLVAVGYPDPEGIIPRSVKKSLDSVRRYNALPAN